MTFSLKTLSSQEFNCTALSVMKAATRQDLFMDMKSAQAELFVHLAFTKVTVDKCNCK